jgi:integrase-like protein
VPKPLRFHDTRSTFATHLRERTGDVVLVQKRLGHSSPAITAEIYSGVRQPYALEMINKLQFGAAPAPVSGTGPARAQAPSSDPTSVVTQPPGTSGDSQRALQESNLRPLAPEADRGTFPRVGALHKHSYHLRFPKVGICSRWPVLGPFLLPKAGQERKKLKTVFNVTQVR